MLHLFKKVVWFCVWSTCFFVFALILIFGSLYAVMIGWQHTRYLPPPFEDAIQWLMHRIEGPLLDWIEEWIEGRPKYPWLSEAPNDNQTIPCPARVYCGRCPNGCPWLFHYYDGNGVEASPK